MTVTVKVMQPGTLLPVLIEAEIGEVDVPELLGVIHRMRARTWKDAPELVRMQGQDGVAHMTFYDPDRELSFVWDGTNGAEVEVAHGGYGEPVIAVFQWQTTGEALEDRSGLADFEQVCRRWS